MRSTAAVSLACLLAAPVAAAAQTSTLPTTATLNPRGDLVENLTHDPDKARRAEAATHPPHGRLCYNQTEARDAVSVRRLVDPVRALRLGRQQGDALSARLCRWTPDEYVYEISVLRHDGRVLRMFMNAQSGEAVAGQPGAAIAGAGGQGTRPADREH